MVAYISEPFTEAACDEGEEGVVPQQLLTAAGHAESETVALPQGLHRDGRVPGIDEFKLAQDCLLYTSIGQTDFNAPLRLAVDTLTAEARPDVNLAILLLTDGEGDLDSDVAQDIQAGGIMFFSVRISKSSATGSQARALIDLANATGGFDTRLKPAADGSVDTAALLESFNNAFEASTENRVSMEEDLLISSEETSLYQFRCV